EARRLAEQRAAIDAEGDPDEAVAIARKLADDAAQTLSKTREVLAEGQARRESLANARDETASALATARAELAGIEREWQALKRDREARAKQAAGKHGLPAALDRIAVEPGYER